MTVDNAQAAPCQLGSLALSPVHKLVVLVLVFCEEDDPGTVRVKMPLLYHLCSAPIRPHVVTHALQAHIAATNVAQPLNLLSTLT